MKDISLRPILEKDAVSISRIRSQSSSFLHDDTNFSAESTLDWIQKMKPDWYAILLDGEMIGYFRLSNKSDKNRNLYIGADIEETHRGKGIGYQSYLIMMERLFKERRLNKISLEVLSNNERAYSLYKKIGFSVEGTKRQEVWRDGQWLDSVVMSITRSEFMILHPGRIQSPCIGICHRNENGCSTCGRTIQQISTWGKCEDAERMVHMSQLKPKIGNTIT